MIDLCKHTQFKVLEIWEPRWHDRRALIAKYKVGEHNKITFPKTKSMPDTYYLSGKTIKKYKQESNGTIMCYCVPLDELEQLKLNDMCIHLA